MIVPTAMTHSPLPFPLRIQCPPGACNCGREALLANPAGDLRVLRLTRDDEKRLLVRLESLTSLADLRYMEVQIEQKLGVQIEITISPNVVRTLRGITIRVMAQPGLCRKTRQAIPAAIKCSLEQRPDIAYALLNVGGLFEAD